MTRFPAALLAAIVLARAAAAQAPAASAELTRARILVEDRKYLDALDLLLDAFQKDPNNTDVKVELATVGARLLEQEHEQSLTPDERRQAVAEAIQVLAKGKTRNEQLKEQLDLIHQKLDVQTGTSLLDATEELAKLDREAIENRLLRQQMLDYLQAVRQKLRSAMAKGVFVQAKDAMVARGYIWYYNNDLPQALELWKKALALDPGDNALREQTQWLEKKIRAAQRDETIAKMFKLANVLAEHGELDEARSQIKAIRLLEPGDSMHKDLDDLEEKVRQKDLVRRLARARKKSLEAEPLKAAEAWLSVLELDPVNAQARQELSRIQDNLVNRSPAPARKSPSHPSHVVAPAASSPSAEQQYALGLIYYQQNDLAKARDAMEKALSFAPGFKAAQISLDRIKSELGETP